MARALRLALPVCIAAILAALPSAAASKPSLRLVDDASLELAGRGFDARERVRLRVEIGGERAVRRTRASRSGTFRLAFPGLSTDDPCSGMSAVAIGRDGSRATLKRAPRQCPPPLVPTQQGGTAPGDGSCGPPQTGPSAQEAGKRAQPACPPN
jgi:hypothetical protein